MIPRMSRVLAGVVVAALGAALVSAQSADATWPPPGVITVPGPGITKPVATTQARLVYPPEAQRRRIQGVVSVACVVEPDGTVGPTRIVQSLDKEFGIDEQALAAVRKLQFKPGTRDGVPARILVTVNLFFSIPGVPPPSTWPALLTHEPSPAGDTTKWLENVAAAGKTVVRVSYPPTWSVDRRPGAIIHLFRPDGDEVLTIPPPRALPMQLVQPLPLQQLQFFGETMRRSAGALELDSAGIGQGLLGNRWWVWQELHVPTSLFDRFAIQLQAPEIAQFEAARLWHFTTGVGNDLVMVFVQRLIRSGQTAETTQAQLRASGQTFDQIIRRITFESR